MSVNEENGNSRYEKQATDITFKLSNNSYVIAEYATSRNGQLIDFNNSTNGGLSQTDINNAGDGDAYRVDVRLDLQDFSVLQGVVSAWTTRQDAGFESFTRSGEQYKQHGVEGEYKVNPELRLGGRYVIDDREEKQYRGQLRGDYDMTDKVTLSGEYRRDGENSDDGEDRKDTVAAQTSYQMTEATRVYAKVQRQFNEQGRYDEAGESDKQDVSLGVENQFSSKLRLHAEASEGDLGSGQRAGVTYTPTPGHDYYLNLDRLEEDNGDRRNGLTAGQRNQVTDKLSVYQEYQFDRRDRLASGDEDSTDRVWGLRYQLNEGWSLGGSYERSDVTGDDINDFQRQAGSVYADYNDQDTRGGVRIEVRDDDFHDDNLNDETQYLLSARWRQVIDQEWTWLSRLETSRTEADNDEKLARFLEARLGFAYRPLWQDRLNMLGLYRYIYDLNPLAQLPTETDEESHILSLDWVYEVDRYWELGGKLAFKESRIRLERDQGRWIRGGVGLGALRARYHLIKQWDLMAEYRYREVLEGGGNQQGALLETGYHVNEHFRASVGYNFSDFSDDIADEDYDRSGWYFNLIGKY